MRLYSYDGESARSKTQHEVFSQANSGRRMPQVASTGSNKALIPEQRGTDLSNEEEDDLFSLYEEGKSAEKARTPS